MNTTVENILCKNIDPSKKELIKKLNALFDQLNKLLPESVIIAFSGGVDSSFLLWAAEQIRLTNGGRLLAITTSSASMPERDLADAKSLAKLLGIELHIENSNELSFPEYSRNDSERCYHCKTELFRITHDIASKNDYKHILYGYNFSDIGDIRPGHKAALENNIVSPLLEAELTKEDIRFVMQAYGLPFFDKASSPCLSSRIMFGVEVTEERLKDIQVMENILYDGGLKTFRVRISKNDEKLFIRIEVAPNEMVKVLDFRDILLTEGTKRGYRWVTLDLNGYKMGGGTI
jgi:pyridinium-3,5-biscarboxylic acid mononucleotide sulfurtransferase